MTESTHESMNPERLAEIRERVEASSWTPEELWTHFEDDYAGWGVVTYEAGYGPAFVAQEIRQNQDRGESDAALIANAPQDLTDLLAEVERLRARLTVDDDMVTRAVEAHHKAFMEWPAKRNLEDAENRRVAAMRAALDAALGTGEGA